MRKLFFFMLAMLVCSLEISAQIHTVKGTIFDATNNEPLVGATVAPIGGGQGVATDIDGNFVLRVPQGVKKSKNNLCRLHSDNCRTKRWHEGFSSIRICGA